MYRPFFSANKKVGSNIKSGYFSVWPTYSMLLPMYLQSVLFWNNLFVCCDYVSLIFSFHETERPRMVGFGGRKNAGKKKGRVVRR